MKDKGFTLIETIASLSIILIIISLCRSFNYMGSKLRDEIENTESVYEIESLITYSKEKCKHDKKEGNILINTDKNKIIFHRNNVIEKELDLPKDIKIISESSKILIGRNGRLKNPTSILVKDNFGDIKTTTISVGVDTVNIKDLNHE